MGDRDELLELRRMDELERKAQGGMGAPAPTPQAASLGDVIAGTPLARLAMGAASPLIGAAQLGAHAGDAINRLTGTDPVVSPWIDTQLANYEAAKQRGMKASGTEGFDWMGLGGSLAPSAALAKGIGAALPAARSVMQRAGVGAVQGGAVAAAQPVTNTEEGFWSPKGLQTAVGTAFGGAVPLAVDAVKGVGSGIHTIKNYAPEWMGGRNSNDVAKELANKYLAQSVEGYEPKILSDIAQAKQQAPVPQSAFGTVVPAPPRFDTMLKGSHPSVGQIGAGTPEWARIQALEKRIRGQQEALIPSNIRASEQEAARATALTDQLVPYANPDVQAMNDAVRARALPLKEQALDAANKLNANGSMRGMPTSKLNANLFDVEQQFKGNNLVEDYVRKMREYVIKQAREFHPSGTRVDARTMANMRDKIKGDIAALSGSDRTQKQRLQKVVIDVQQAVDDAIEGAGKTGKWERWRDIYSGGMKEIERVETGMGLAEASKKSAGALTRQGTEAIEDSRALSHADKQTIATVMADKQREFRSLRPRVPGTSDSSSQTAQQHRIDLPNILNRAITGTEWLVAQKRDTLPPLMDKYYGEVLRDPGKFEAVIRSAQAKGIPSRYRPMIDALMQQAPAAAGTAAGRSAQ